MNDKHPQRTTMTRRRFASFGIAALAATHVRAQEDSPENIPWELVPLSDLFTMITQPDFGEWSTWSLAAVFARSGIAVFDDEVTAPLIAPSAPISPLSFQFWQLESMVEELRDESFGSTAPFNEMFPTETDDGDAIPNVGEIIAGYYGIDTSGAEFTRLYLDQVIEVDTLVDVNAFPAPTAILALLSGEILAEMHASLEVAEKQTSFGFAAFQSTGLSLPGLPEVPQLPSGISIEIPQIQVNTICSQGQAFITTVQQRVFSVLDAASKSTSNIPIFGKIVQVLVDGIKLGILAIFKAVDAVLSPVLGILRTIGAALAVASQIVGLLSPWTVKVTADPNPNRFGIDGEIVTGDLHISAGGWDVIPIPPFIRDCASVAGVPLPEPTAKDAGVLVSVDQSEPLIALNSTYLTLDIDAKTSTSYVTGVETSEEAQGIPVYSVAWINVTVERDDLKRLRDQLVNLLFSTLPELVSKIVRPIVGPVADQLSNRLIALASVRRTKMVTIIHHILPERDPNEPTAEAQTGNGGVGCPGGPYELVDPTAILKVLPEVETTYSGYMIWDFRSDGSIEVWTNGIEISMNNGGPTFWGTIVGSATGTWKTSGNNLTVSLSNGDLWVQFDVFGVPMSGRSYSGTYTCGDTLLFHVVDPEVSYTYEFIPIEG